MIQRIRHKGLRRLHATGSAEGIRPADARRLRLILTVLNAAKNIRDVDLPGLRLHPLRGDLKGSWSVSVSGNWRVVFRLEDSDVFDVDLVDYH